MSDSIKTLCYKFAANLDAGKAHARTIYSIYPNLHESIEPEVRAELMAGFLLRYSETCTDGGFYVRDGDAYIETDAKRWETAKGEKIHLTVAFATSETPQKFGQMRTDNPALFNLVKPLRDKSNKYASNTLASLVRNIREIANEGNERTRASTAFFADVVKTSLDTLKNRCRNAKARGDDTADDAKLNAAIASFYKVWK